MNVETNKGLIIKKEWLDKIFDEGKVFEMRSTKTKIRGKIKLIESKSGTIVGECDLIDCHELTDLEKVSEIENHKVYDLSLLDRWSYAWHLSNPVRYEVPVPYQHPRGAVIWVNLT